MIVAGETRAGISGSRMVQSLVPRLAERLQLPEEEENLILAASMGASAVASGGEERRKNLLIALGNALDSREASGTQTHELEPWQRAFDWNSSILLRNLLIERGLPETEADGQAFELNELMRLWRSTSPFTVDDAGQYPQYEFQTTPGLTHVETVRELVQSELARYHVEKLTVHKVLRWECDSETVPLAAERPEWFENPSRDAVDDGFDEEHLDEELPLDLVMLSNYSGFMLDGDLALESARYDSRGEPTPYYAVLTATVDARAVVSVPSIGFGSLTKGEVVLDRRMLMGHLTAPSFRVLIGRAS